MNRALGFLRFLPVLPACLAAIVLGGCWDSGVQSRWIGAELWVLTSFPKKIRVGDAEIALRIQDRDYKIKKLTQGTLRFRDPLGKIEEQAALPAGAGTLRAKVFFGMPGKHRLFFAAEAAGDTFSGSAEFWIQVEPGRSTRF